jgi:hypothetical protein
MPPRVGHVPRCLSACTGAAEANAALIRACKPDKHSSVLSEKCREDAGLGRMSVPVLAASVDWSAVCMAPRFSCAQGSKIRPIDDFSRNGLNDATGTCESFTHNTVDQLFSACRSATKQGKRGCSLYKADIDAAFRHAHRHVAMPRLWVSPLQEDPFAQRAP